MRVLVAGASGFLGSHLVADLRSAGHQVSTLSRGAAGPQSTSWDPYAGKLDPAAIEDTDVVVNLAGSPTAGNPHSGRWARQLRNSRVTTTRVLADAIAASSRRPAFLAGNGISYYGDHGDQVLDEDADTHGDGFLTKVARDWQVAAEPAVRSGSRVCILRTAPVMDAESAPLKQLQLLFRTGLGGRLGSGDQYFPMISLRDWVGAVRYLVEHDDLSGPVNLCCASTPTNAQFTGALADLVHRPAFLAVPSIVLKQAAGRMAPELLGSVRAVPRALLDSGFRFADPEVVSVLETGTRGVGSGA